MIVLCLVDFQNILDSLVPVNVLLAGWSKMDEILKAPIKLTGKDNMWKVNNYQLTESDLHEMSDFFSAIL
jgi:hypothetical protein